MDSNQRKAVKKCYNAVEALIQERKDVNTQIKEEWKITSEATGWPVQSLKDGFSLFKKGMRLDDIQELYEVFNEMDNSYIEEDE